MDVDLITAVGNTTNPTEEHCPCVVDGAVVEPGNRRDAGDMVDNNPEAWEVMRNRIGDGSLPSSVEYVDLTESGHIKAALGP